MERLFDYEGKYVEEKEKNIQEIENFIFENMDFYSSDGVKVCIVLKHSKDLVYFKNINDVKYEIYFLPYDKEKEYSFGVFKKTDLKNIGSFLKDNKDRRVYVGVVNDYF